MNRGNVYVFIPDPAHPLGGWVERQVATLARLDPTTPGRLWGCHVRVRNAGWVNEPDPVTGRARPVPIGDARPDADGDFLFEPGHGGGRMDKIALAEPDFRERYLQAAHFGEVNTYYHVDRIADYVAGLLRELGAPPLPPLIAVVNAHHAAVADEGGGRDGVWRRERWLPFQGGHYRLTRRTREVAEHEPVSPLGEIHLGPGFELLEHGALAEAAGGRYRANASHNAGIIYHEYGHHITRHTADLRANALRPPLRQSNRKTALDEGVCDYWSAVMQASPHIWAWHHRHDATEVHRRSLTSAKTMADYVHGPDADPHINGTIWAAALWELRCRMAGAEEGGARRTDLLLLQSLLLIGALRGDAEPPTLKSVRRARRGFGVGLRALLDADDHLCEGRHRELILATFTRRGIHPKPRLTGSADAPVRAAMGFPAHSFSPVLQTLPVSSAPLARLLRRVAPDEIPATDDLYTAAELEAHLCSLERDLGEPPLALIAVGDIMLGANARRCWGVSGPDYQFASVLPLLRCAPIVLGNLEAPFARHTPGRWRTYTYRMNPHHAPALARAGFGVVNLANNHLLDCGRDGVRETLDALARAGIGRIGAGLDSADAHAPVILQAGPYRVGLLGYYWNRRTAATADQPGSAMDTPEALERDLRDLRRRADRIVVTIHWGVPYEREPAAEVRAKARLIIDCGADAVIGHHPHIVQPFELYRGRPIFYSVGNFAFGSGNSRAESLLVGLSFAEDRTLVRIYPVYVKNRDPRVNYQPRVLRGAAAARQLSRLAAISGPSGTLLKTDSGRGLLDLPRPEGIADCGLQIALNPIFRI